MRSRRSFLHGVATVSALGSTPGLALQTVEVMNTGPETRPFTLQWFAPHVGTEFRVQTNHGQLALSLVSADALPRHSAIEGEKFSLVFSGPRDLQLTQQVCRFEHAKLGNLDLFLVPILTRRKDCFLYEAIFNQESAD